MGLDAALSHKHLYTGYTTTEKKHASTHARESRVHTRRSEKRFIMTRVLRVETRSRRGSAKAFGGSVFILRTVRFWVSFISILALRFPSLGPIHGIDAHRETKETMIWSRGSERKARSHFRGVVVSSTMITAMSHSKQGIDYL